MMLMAWFRDAPIRRKLLLIGLLTTGLALLLISLVLTAKDFVEWRNRTVGELTTYARVVGANAAPAMLFEDHKAAAETLSALSAKPDIVHAIIFDREGREFAAYHAHAHLMHQPHSNSGAEHHFTPDNLTVSGPVSFNGELLGSILLESDLGDLYAGIQRSVVLIFFTAFCAFAAAAFLFSRLQRVIAAPIHDMAGTMRNVIGKQDFTARVAQHGKDELGVLADTFNAMLGYIQLRDAELVQHRTRLEEQVALRTARLTEAQRIGHIGDWEWDIANDTLAWSDETYRIFGLVPQQFAASYKAFLQAVHPDDRQLVDSRVSAALEQAQSYSIDHRIVRPDGQVRYVHEQAELSCNKDGRLAKMLGTVQDITERKEYEDELKRSNVDLEQFSYAVSHDMRQPLRMISSYLQLIELNLGDKLDDERRSYFSVAIDGAKRIDRMLMALLEYSRVGRVSEPPVRINSRAVLDEALQHLQPDIAEAQAQLSVSGDWPHIVAYRDEMLRLLQNLASNAIKYRIEGRTPEITITGQVAGNEWYLCVADNGAGVATGQTGRLFQVFQRLHSRGVYEGTGIGLALCRKIVEHHKGRIWVESAGEGQGSRFYVVLPVLRERPVFAGGNI